MASASPSASVQTSLVRAAPLTRRAAAHVLTPPGLRRCAGSASAADLICGMEGLYTYDTILEAYEQRGGRGLESCDAAPQDVDSAPQDVDAAAAESSAVPMRLRWLFQLAAPGAVVVACACLLRALGPRAVGARAAEERVRRATWRPAALKPADLEGYDLRPNEAAMEQRAFPLGERQAADGL